MPPSMPSPFTPQAVVKRLQHQLAQAAFLIAQTDLNDSSHGHLVEWAMTARIALDALIPAESETASEQNPDAAFH
jgi:aromatic ring-cleaving dioxygenase